MKFLFDNNLVVKECINKKNIKIKKLITKFMIINSICNKPSYNAFINKNESKIEIFIDISFYMKFLFDNNLVIIEMY